jgi:hypothetical protein
MRLPNLTIAKKFAQVRGHFNLSRVRPGSMNAFIESDWGSAHCFQRHRAGYIGKKRDPFGAVQGKTTDGNHRLGAVE